MKNKGGRPTEYSEEILTKSEEYLSSCRDVDEDRENNIKAKVNIPSIEGLAYFIRISRSTLYLWKQEHKEFSDIIEDLQQIQASKLINGGLSGTYNPTIAKVLMTKHGYREGIDATTNDKDISNPVLVKFVDDKTTDNN